MCGGPCPPSETADLREAAALANAYRGRASVVIVSQGEQTPGETEAAIRDAGLDVPVVFDWDGRIAQRLGVGILGVILLDAEGRVVTTWGITPGRPTAAEVSAALDGLVAPAASPSPSP
jgi:peroxiredoxin